jgi:hypothetical protein
MADYPVITVGPLANRNEPEWRVHVQWQPGDPTESYSIEAATDLAHMKEREGDAKLAERLRVAVESAKIRQAL